MSDLQIDILFTTVSQHLCIQIWKDAQSKNLFFTLVFPNTLRSDGMLLLLKKKGAADLDAYLLVQVEPLKVTETGGHD